MLKLKFTLKHKRHEILCELRQNDSSIQTRIPNLDMINKEKVVDYVVATKCIFERNWKLGKYRDILKHGDSYEYHSLLEHFTRLQRLNKKKQSNKKQKKLVM